MKTIQFPEAKFDDIFVSQNKDQLPDIHVGKNMWGDEGPGLSISSYCCFHGESIYVRPSQKVIDFIENNMIHNGDCVSFQIVKRKDGHLIVVRHNNIIGSRWLALVYDVPFDFH